MNIWKDVFWFFTTVFVVLALVVPFTGGVSLPGLMVLLASGISLISLYGYAYQIPIGSKTIATVVFGCSTLLVLGGLMQYGYALITHWGMGAVWFTILVLAYMFLFLYPQYRYALKSDHIWQPIENN